MDSKQIAQVVAYAKKVDRYDDEYHSPLNVSHNYGDRSPGELMGILARGILALEEKNKKLRAKIKEVRNESA